MKRTSIVGLCLLAAAACNSRDVDEGVASVAQAVELPAEALAVLMAEDPSLWTAESGPAPTSSIDRTQGMGSIVVQPNSYTRYFSDPFPTSGAITEVKLDFYQSAQPSSWKGNLELELMCPSRNLNWQWIGQVQLANQPVEEWFEASFPLSQNQQDQLFGAECEQLDVRLIVNPGTPGTAFQFDYIRLVGTPGGSQCAVDADCDSGTCDNGTCAPSPTFYNEHDLGHLERIKEAIQASDGGFLMVGTQSIYDPDPRPAGLVVKLDAAGGVSWSRRFEEGAGSWSFFHDIVERPDGGYVIAGYRVQLEPRAAEWLVVALDADGNTEWTTTHPAGGYTTATNINVELTPDGGIYVLGPIDIPRTDPLLWQDPVPHLWKLNAAGEPQWLVQLEELMWLNVKSTAVRPNGDILYAGDIDHAAGWLVSARDANGDPTGYQETFDDRGYPYAMELTSDGGFVVGLWVAAGGVISKFDAAGTRTWSRTYDSHILNLQAVNGGYSAVGYVRYYGFLPRVFTVDAAGDVTDWRDVSGVAGDVGIYAGLRTDDLGWFLVGPLTTAGEDVFSVKLLANGNL